MSDVSLLTFDDFWKLYPLKQQKKLCRLIWQKRRLDDIAETIIHNVEQRLKEDDSWANGYIHAPRNYLNNEGWEDDIRKRPNKATSNNKVSRTESFYNDCFDGIQKNRIDTGTD